jgi:hypothetical protein
VIYKFWCGIGGYFKLTNQRPAEGGFGFCGADFDAKLRHILANYDSV